MVMIAGVFVGGGTVLLATQFFVLRALLSEAVTVENEQLVENTERSGPGLIDDETKVEVIQYGPLWSQADPVVAQVLTDVQIWSGVLLLAFALLAGLGAWLVSRHALRRIAQVTDATNEITEHDLSKRLDLPGPDDEITRLGSAIDQMVERLEDAFVRQQAFIANASHEFRTPLTTARMALQVAIRQDRVPNELMPEIKGVLDANRRMEALVAALLIVAQGRAGADLTHDRVDLVALIAQVMAEQADAAERAQLTARIDLPDEPVMLTGNEPLLRSLLSNLATNAVRHNEPGGFVEIALRARGDEVVFTVENSGDREYAPEEVQRLTEPFQRGERSRLCNDDGTEAGTGLGLTLVQSIAELHGGALTLTARPDGGLRVVLVLPKTTRREGDIEVTETITMA